MLVPKHDLQIKSWIYNYSHRETNPHLGTFSLIFRDRGREGGGGGGRKKKRKGEGEREKERKI